MPIQIDELEQKFTQYHISIRVDKAIELLNKGQNLFEPATVDEVWHELNKRRNKKLEYITGCDNEGETGKCQGHKPKEPSVMDKVKEGLETAEDKVEKKILKEKQCPSCVAGLGAHRNCILR